MSRKARFTDAAVNQPIDPDKFSLKALELPEGGIIDDRVRKKAFEYKNGKPVFLAKYGSTKYMNQEELETLRGGRARIAVVVLGLSLFGAGIFLRLRRRKRRGASLSDR